ncbi:MAG: DUF1588 domain-containing protein [Akkermansiaceae bacterium]|nr:DUF1588 domain-containing protein [Akkermansiaceae bacterium]MDG1671896.1 DUF1588 domain-containing protein [Akkermansiaceae bacterium]
MKQIGLIVVSITCLVGSAVLAASFDEKAVEVLEHYCFDCHDDASQKGNLNMEKLLREDSFDGALMFENLLTGKMPPAKKEQPEAEEKRAVLDWLAKQQRDHHQKSFRRLSRHEFVHSVNDLLGTNLDLAGKIPEDRGTNDFDSNRKIQLSREMLGSYFSVADEMLDQAFPEDGFPVEKSWVVNRVRDSHEMYRSFHRPYQDGTLFSWTRSNNGISYSFFYDGFEPPVAGWYELTFDAAKVADFEDDMSLQVHAGRYYYADDRPQPQRLLGVISLGNREVESRTIRAYLHPGESVSVHCYSRHNFRERNPKRGIYIKQLKVRGPLVDSWPPSSYQQVFDGLPIEAPSREDGEVLGFQTKLQEIGGSVSVSSFQTGMEKEKMQDGSNLTFWHTRFSPTVAKPPHYVIFENPNGAGIEGLSFATWQGGNGNGLVKAFEVYFSDDGKNWGEKVMVGDLDVSFANVQPIVFPKKTTRRFIKFLITDAVSLDGKSIASIGKLDVVTSLRAPAESSAIEVASRSPKDLKGVIRRFAGRAFSSTLSEEELEPYYQLGLLRLDDGGDFVQATKVGLKAILCSPRFLMAPGEHANPSFARAADLARVLWLSVPDEELLSVAAAGEFHGESLRSQVVRMLDDQRSARMIRSFSDQWLNLRGLNKVTPSLKLYPLYDDLLNHFLPIETRRYLQHLVQEDLPARNLIDSDFTFLNQRLARHYGVEGVVGQKMRKVTFPAGSPRGGLMTMASVLKVTTDGFDTSPILRGAWISKNIVGTPLSPPPESVPALEPEHGEAKTLKEQIDQHKSNKTCYACHKSIDPYGFALESFDASGEWRARYKIKQAHRSTFTYRPQGFFKIGAVVDASGEIGEDRFENIFGLKKVLLSNQQKIAYNFAKKFFEYARGEKPNLEQRLHLWDFLGKAEENVRLKNIVTEVLIITLNESKR